MTPDDLDGSRLFGMLTEIIARIGALEAAQARSGHAIMGNGTKGLAQRLDELEDDVKRIAPVKWQAFASIAAALLAAGAAVTVALVR